MRAAQGVWALLQRDVRGEWRSKQRSTPMLFFALSSMVVLSLSLGGVPAGREGLGAGVLWCCFVFASLLGLGHTFSEDVEDGALEGVLIAPVEGWVVYGGKMLSNALFLLAVEVLCWPVFAVFFSVDPGWYWMALLGVFGLGALALAAVGTLFAAIASNLRLRELLLPVLLLPVMCPVVIACVGATRTILARGGGAVGPYLRILAVFIVVYTTLSVLLFERVVEE